VRVHAPVHKVRLELAR